MTRKLHEVLAIEKSLKPRTYSALTEANKLVQKEALFNGQTRVFEKLNDDSPDLSPESTKVQADVTKTVASNAVKLTEFYDLEASKNAANCSARADVIVNGETLLHDMPATTLLFLEKQLTDLRTFTSNLPVLDPSVDWSKDGATGLWKSAPIRTQRPVKVQKPIVLYPATKEHAAQTQLITETVNVGHWVTTKLSSALPRPEREARVERINVLLTAVRTARERANSVEAPPVAIGKAIFEHLFA